MEHSSVSFSDYGLKNTAHRQLIYDLLRNQHRPVRADDLYKEMANQNQSISLSTVYRILDAFVSKGLVMKVTFENDGIIYYELPHSKHTHHLICLSCHEVIHFEHCPMHEFEHYLAEKTHFLIADHQLDVYGYCPKCISKQPDKMEKGHTHE